MAMGDKIKHAGQDLTGKAKEGAGKVTGNQDLQAAGHADQATAAVKKAGDDVADATRETLP